jgi:DNA-binding NtrC family response regulator
LPFEPNVKKSGKRGNATRRKRMKYFKLTEPPTVLIVDQDLGFVWWLGEILHSGGCTVVPALNCQQALTLVKESRLNLDLILVDPTLTGVPSMLETIRAAQDGIKVLDLASVATTD